MNEEELKEEIKRLKKFPEDKPYKNMCIFDEIRVLKAELKGFQKGKLEQRKEELYFIIPIFNRLNLDGLIGTQIIRDDIEKRIKKLQKEIGGMK